MTASDRTASDSLAAIVLAAGKGTRMKSALPKVMHPVAGRAMVLHVLGAAAALGAARSVVVIGPDMPEVAAAVAPAPTAVQVQQLGTADAVKAAQAALGDFRGTVFILYGDTPLITPETLRHMQAARERDKPQAAIVVLGFRPADPGAYGRLVVDRSGALTAIVEAKDATPDELRIDLCNSGVMAVDGALLWELLAEVGNANAKGEYYLTDIVGLARKRQLRCLYVEAPETELLGVNDRADLARAEAALQDRLRRAAMANGVTMTDPASVFLAWDTRLGRDVTIGPNVVFGPGAAIDDDVEIRAFCHIEGAEIGKGAVIGPFARLRPGTKLGAAVHIGNFVECKAALLGDGAKANHLAYVGDAEIGAKTNIGAGTITANYDGYFKHKTVVGKGVSIGSNTVLVAPVTVGDGALVGAGSAITRDIEADSIAVTRAETKSLPGAAKRYREKKAAEKAAKATGKGK
ncbi:MAG: bifunctional UDP-N-acetylglucosamine diphosphorylase/glucosamine-1-phosphate N-acetyltransferase GlmU [Rhodospirillaceae bacterium]|nr:bifunctional UDP-N-acetylglucosamine diphosphorylase/glucosamine-1-phosphate N-acetyltransferase GlmU [Rhodospirillaceae bacterium]